jgi:hypothetical protein
MGDDGDDCSKRDLKQRFVEERDLLVEAEQEPQDRQKMAILEAWRTTCSGSQASAGLAAAEEAAIDDGDVVAADDGGDASCLESRRKWNGVESQRRRQRESAI